MEKLYALIFLLFPVLAQSQELAFSKPAPPGFPTIPVRSAPADDNHVSADELLQNIGRQITFCGKVYLAKQQKDELGLHSVFYVAGKYVNECVDIKIRLDEGYSFPADMCKNLNFKNVCITGTVLSEDGAGTMYLDSNNMRNLIAEAEKAKPESHEEITQDRELKVLANAYLLTGPRWKDPVITFLKAGSVIIAEEVRGSWAYVRVIEQNGREVASSDIAGYMNLKHLGLGAKGTIILPR